MHHRMQRFIVPVPSHPLVHAAVPPPPPGALVRSRHHHCPGDASVHPEAAERAARGDAGSWKRHRCRGESTHGITWRRQTRMIDVTGCTRASLHYDKHGRFFVVVLFFVFFLPCNMPFVRSRVFFSFNVPRQTMKKRNKKNFSRAENVYERQHDTSDLRLRVIDVNFFVAFFATRRSNGETRATHAPCLHARVVFVYLFLLG